MRRNARPASWEGIPLKKLIAECDMRKRRITGVHRFETCLHFDKRICSRARCIIWLLVEALKRRGAHVHARKAIPV